MVTILETGNHIAQNGDGNERRQVARVFKDQVLLALTGKPPFTPMTFPKSQDVQVWLERFPEYARQGQGFWDVSIIHAWEQVCEAYPHRRVSLWSLDKHLAAF